MNILTLTAYSPEYESIQRNTDRIASKFRGPQSHISIRYTPKPFSYPRAMRFGCDMALMMPDWEWLVMMDADGIFVSMEKPPSTGFGACHRYTQRLWEPESELLTHEDHWTPSSYFILSRELVEKRWCRYSHLFEGYGWDDFDFFYNVLEPNGISFGETDAKAIHVHHAPCRTEVNPKNREIFSERYIHFHPGAITVPTILL